MSESALCYAVTLLRMRGGKEKGEELESSEKVVYLQVENKNADENRNSKNS